MSVCMDVTTKDTACSGCLLNKSTIYINLDSKNSPKPLFEKQKNKQKTISGSNY